MPEQHVPPFPAVDPRDLVVVTEQLGRPARGVVRVAARATSRALRNSVIPLTRMTSAPRDAALAARSTGRMSPSSWPDSSLRNR